MLRTLTTAVLVAFALALTPPAALASADLPVQEAATRQAGRPPAQEPVSINLNTATATELEKLPGVGPATAARIVEYRQKNGAFKKIEDLMNVRGIGEKTFLTLKPLINVAPPKGGAW